MINRKQYLKQMTFEEKAELLTGAGALTLHGVPRLGIPGLSVSDGPHGVRRLVGHPKFPQECHIPGGDVCFPTGSAMGATWDAGLVRRVGAAIARDCRQEGVDILLAPGVNMKRTPLCGRNFEYFSEDPVLSAGLGAAFIEGVQSEGVGTALKHFAANNQETDRDHVSVEVDERALREVYLAAFELLLAQVKPTAVMCAYNKLNGIWCSENRFLLDTVLKQEWGYDGLVVSDWGAVHDEARALAAGLDLQMPQNKNIVERLRAGLDSGVVTMEDIDRAAGKVLELIGWVTENRKAEDAPYDRAAQHALAEEAAIEAITLLKNDNGLLPLSPEEYKRIAVFGCHAENPVIMGGGSSRVTVLPESVDIPLDCIRQLAGTQTEILYDSLYGDTTQLIDEGVQHKINGYKGKVDAIILFIGDNKGTESETESMDRQSLAFPNYMNLAVSAACDICENTVVVMQTGAACIPFRWHERAKAIVQMWYAGEAGGSAVAKILFGLASPGGRLSETFARTPRADLEYPGDGRKVWYREGLFAGYRYYDGHPDEVWYPFGHGLTYTGFAYSEFELETRGADTKEPEVTVRFRVTNTGKRDGREVVQLYVRKPDSVALRPFKELKRFDKLTLAPGESKTAAFTLGRRDFAFYNPCLRDWHVEPGGYEILVGASSADIRLTGTFILTNDGGFPGWV